MDDILFSTPDNPAPAHCTAGYFSGWRGAKLRYAIFRSDVSPARGTIVLLQGRNEFIEKYFETIRQLNDMGFWVATYDLRGQGGSDRLLKQQRKGYVRHFSDYEHDLDLFLQQIVLPDTRLPFFLLAHSTGALIALSRAPYMANRIDRMVLAAPFVGLTGQALSESTVRRLSGLMTAIGIGRQSMGNDQSNRPYEGNPLTSDRNRFERNAKIAADHPELTIGAPTARWLRETLRASARVSQQPHLTRITIPTVILAPMLDGIVPYAKQELLSRNFRAGQLVTITGARHELFQEIDIYRVQALATIEAFFTGTEIAGAFSESNE
jgi:lysophospholipase